MRPYNKKDPRFGEKPQGRQSVARMETEGIMWNLPSESRYG